ncbi:MAG: TRAP transporter small permease [Proteobacteria bacterium]|nr:TRAP transporter small permease [Pseudomonadota bacterium]
MKSLLSRLDRVGRFSENTALVVLLSTMMLLAVAQIVLREVFSTGFIWADELIKLLVLWLAMVGSVAASRDNRHIRIDALSHILPDTAIKLTRILVDLFAVAVCAVIAWFSYQYLLLEIEFEDKVLIDTPAWIAHLIVPLAFAVISYRFAVSLAWQGDSLITGNESEVDT